MTETKAGTSNDFAELDFFRAKALWQDPYPYYEWLRQEMGPVWQEPRRGVAMVTGLDEAASIYRDGERWSSCNSVSGPFTKFPVPLEGDDISEIIEAHRDTLPFSNQLPTFDGERHAAHRALLMRLLSRKRLKENEEFMWRLADRQLDEVLARDACDFPRDYANPYTMLVIADLLGVPEEDHDRFRGELAGVAEASSPHEHDPLGFLYDRFTAYIEERRAEPRDDVMTGLATATFPDGSLPEVRDIMLIASNLFAAGQETTARLMGTMLRFLGERPELQAQLREKRALIPNFVEECVRLESPIQGEFRLSRVATTVGSVDLPPGTIAFLLNGAANRDPREFEDPAEIRLDRRNGLYHLGFGFGVHLCAGAPLARAEARVTLERLFDRTAAIRISEEHHGPPGDRRYAYTPIYMLRGLEHLHVELLST